MRGVSGEEWLSAFTQFDTRLFFLIFLPPIIFESGYHLNHLSFFQNVLSISAFAFIGTLISCAVFAIVLYFFQSYVPDHQLPFLECLTFGALISATDPVTVLAIFKELKVDVDLYANVFGERSV